MSTFSLINPSLEMHAGENGNALHKVRDLDGCTGVCCLQIRLVQLCWDMMFVDLSSFSLINPSQEMHAGGGEGSTKSNA